MTAPDRRPGSKLPSLDGWRAISIALVVIGHFGHADGFPPAWLPAFHWLDQGGLGVRMFLVISGFLITFLLLREFRTTNEISLGRFYLRRSIRILPVYFAFLAAVALLQFFTPFELPWQTWLLHLTFTTNFVDLPYSATGHLWSIAVEEQFYLIWPVLLVWLGLARRPRAALMVLGVPVAVSPIARVITYKGWATGPAAVLFSSFSFLNYVDVLAIGCAAAVLFTAAQEQVVDRLCGVRAPRVALMASVLIAGPLLVEGFGLLPALRVPFGFTMQALGMAVLLIQSVVLPDTAPCRILNAGPVVHVGVLSYSIYIWHMPFCVPAAALGIPSTWATSYPLWVMPALATAAVSYYCLERPLLQFRERLRAA